MTPAAPLDSSAVSDRLAALEHAMAARIREFEMVALLDLLASIGYGPDDLEFRAHLASGPQPTLLHAIEFRDRGESERASARVVITVNLGLLACRSPLPTYFQRFLQHMDTRDPVLELIEVLDRSLLRARLTGARPGTHAEWERIQRDFTRMFGLDSPIGLTWLFRQVFPELTVRVRRTCGDYQVPYDGAKLGVSALGECSFGDLARIGVQNLEVTLFCEEALYQGTTPWVREGDRRLRSFVVPLLDEVCMTLTVVFVLLDRGEGARLGPTGYVGYNPMLGPGLAQGLPPSRVEVYRGALPRTEPDADDLEKVLAGEVEGALTTTPTRAAPSAAEVLGHAVELAPTYRAPGQRPRHYQATVRWGARTWRRDEPHAIDLRCESIQKMSPSMSLHPRLWAWLRDEARRCAALVEDAKDEREPG